MSAPGPSQILRKRETKHRGSCSRRRRPLPAVRTLTTELVLHKHRCDRAHTLVWSACVRNHVYGPPRCVHGTPCSSPFRPLQGAPLDRCVQLPLRSCAPPPCRGAQQGYTAAYLGDPRARGYQLSGTVQADVLRNRALNGPEPFTVGAGGPLLGASRAVK